MDRSWWRRNARRNASMSTAGDWSGTANGRPLPAHAGIATTVRTDRSAAASLRPDAGKRLSDGTIIQASILARLLGIRLLRLDAQIALVPADLDAPPGDRLGARFGARYPTTVDSIVVDSAAVESAVIDRAVIASADVDSAGIEPIDAGPPATAARPAMAAHLSDAEALLTYASRTLARADRESLRY